MSGSFSLRDISDVSIDLAATADESVLAYDSQTGKFVARPYANGLSASINAALAAAASPSASNPVATLQDVSSGNQSLFTPLSIQNCVVWLDAESQGLVDGDGVQTAYDSSGGGNHFVQATAERRPIYHAASNTRPAHFDFDGVNDYLRSATPTLDQPTVVFMVARFKTDYSSADTMMDGGGAANTLRVYRSALREPIFYAGGNIILDGTAETGWSLFTLVANGASSSFTVGNVTGTGSGATNATGITIGANGVGTPNQYGAVQIAALAVYSRDLTAAEISQIQAYFISKYLRARLIFVGDSIVVGTSAASSNGFSAHTWLSKSVSSVNLGVGGTTVVQMVAKAAYETANWKSQNTLNTVVIMGGTNDLASSGTGAATYAALVRLIKVWQSAGFRVVVVTMLPRTGTDVERAAYNALIRSGAITHNYTVADAGGDALMGQNGQNTDTTYYNVDAVHPNDTGHTRIANYVIAAITWL